MASKLTDEQVSRLRIIAQASVETEQSRPVLSTIKIIVLRADFSADPQGSSGAANGREMSLLPIRKIIVAYAELRCCHGQTSADQLCVA